VIVAGIDVGGPRKGYHGVALRTGRYHDRFHCTDPGEMAAWVRGLGARAVGVDAPCRFSPDGRMRSAERELVRRGIPCFATPSRSKAEGHPFYAWMLNGRNKRSDRRALLEAAGVSTRALGPLDWIDAALCAVAAERLLAGSFQTLGSAEDGPIILPAPSRPPGSASTAGA
jgi:predicted nuclease with RNAse H fold